MSIDLPRKRGARPGNMNAFKHGFYSKRLKEVQPEDLDKAQANGLRDEIILLRMVMLRVLEQAACTEDTDLSTWQKTLSSLSTASARLATLLRAQRQLGGGKDAADALSAALAESLKVVHQEMAASGTYQPELFPPRPVPQ